MKIYRRTAFIVLILIAAVSPAFASESLDQTIAYLINYVEKSNATFIRNDATHTPAEAAQHVRAKYQHFKNQIKTPEDFIRLSASKSLLTGKPYLVRTIDRKETPLENWLTAALKEHRAAAGH